MNNILFAKNILNKQKYQNEILITQAKNNKKNKYK